MKPEEKYFVIKGIREDFQWYNCEEGYWLCSKDKYGISHDYFYKDKTEADRECEKYRESYMEAVSHFKEGDIVWFMNRNKVTVAKVTDIKNIGYKMYYEAADDYNNLSKEDLFKSKEDLMDYLESNIINAV